MVMGVGLLSDQLPIKLDADKGSQKLGNDLRYSKINGISFYFCL